MLQSMSLGDLTLAPPGTVPPFLSPLFDAASRGVDLAGAVLDITRGLGFENFMQGLSLSTVPDSETQSYVFTTLPLEWVALYDQQSYLEVDPRIQNGIQSTLPYVWDARSLRGKSARLDAFLTDAARFGVGSGVSISFRSATGYGCLIALSSRDEQMTAAQRESAERRAGDVLLLGQYFQELVVAAVLQKQLGPISRGSPLSVRERQCLSLASNGMTSADIAIKLNITERTVNFHFGNLFAKLDALNRNEAIAKAIAKGLIPVPR